MMTYHIDMTSFRLNLAHNKLRSLQQLEPILEKMPQINWLNLAGNMIQRWEELEYVVKWPIEGMTHHNDPL